MEVLWPTTFYHWHCTCWLILIYCYHHTPQVDTYYINKGDDVRRDDDVNAWAYDTGVTREGSTTTVCFSRKLNEPRAKVSAQLDPNTSGWYAMPGCPLPAHPLQVLTFLPTGRVMTHTCVPLLFAPLQCLWP